MSRVRYFWCQCGDCEHVWIAGFASELGQLFAVDNYGEECPECGSAEFEPDSEYDGPERDDE